MSTTSVSQTTLEPTLSTLVETPELHCRWLNTLSLLEHIGSRKILMTQSHEGTTEMILRHATEEARHALFFKKAAQSLASETQTTANFGPKSLLAGPSARIYFAKLDASVRKELTKENRPAPEFRYLAYLYTTTLIERRAMVVYHAYNQVLEQKDQPLRLHNLILEEEGHLEEMDAEIQNLDPIYASRLPLLVERESQFFQKFWKSIEAVLPR